MPITLMVASMIAGLAVGLYYSRRRLWVVYGLAAGGRRDAFYTRSPYKQTILIMILAAIVMTSFPQQALAGPPQYDPVFYYYHSDHLGSSTLMTDRYGTIVQKYGYTAFGKEQYKSNTYAFDVSNRYTGQILDEDTGLYYYNARYYDPQLARFTQADTVVPDANTSQALNRYTYVNNNPLKFTDPSGHSFWDEVKKFVGVIVSVVLNIMAPGLGIIMSSIIGSAISTAVNGGTFASFAIGRRYRYSSRLCRKWYR